MSTPFDDSGGATRVEWGRLSGIQKHVQLLADEDGVGWYFEGVDRLEDAGVDSFFVVAGE